MTRDDTPSASPSDVLALDPIYIPGLITPVNGADGGVNYYMIHANAGGLMVVLQPYPLMGENDWVDVYWGDDDSPVASGLVLAEHVDKEFQLYVTANRVPEGIHALKATVTRSGGGNGGTTLPLSVLVRTLFPGGTDPEPGIPGHQNLPPPVPDLPPGGIIDEEAAKDGVKVTIDFYLNMRLADIITLAWSGHEIPHEVTQAEMDAGKAEILVPEAVIRAVGDGDLSLLYRVRDELHNPSSDWSESTRVIVEIGEGLFEAPLIENPDPNADPYDVIDLDELGDDDLLISVMVVSGAGLQAGDLIAPKWLGTTAQGLPVEFSPAPESVPRVPTVMTFLIPNADVRGLGQGHGVASYAASRDGAPLGVSRRSFVTFLGAEQRLPAPALPDAQGGVLDPALTQTTVFIPGEALGANDILVVTWHGTRANGSPLVQEFQRTISGGNAGKPVTLAIDGAALLAPLDGGTLAVYYRVEKDGSGIELRSEQVQVSVGEARAELPTPTTRPPAVEDVLDPEQVVVELEIVIPPWPDMRDGQTVHLLWQGKPGHTHTDFLRINDSTAGREVVFYLDRATLDEYLHESIELSYRVESDDEATQYSAIARFSIGTGQGTLPLPVILEAQGNEVNPDDILQGATVQIAASAQLKDYDVVTIHVISAVTGGSTDIDHPINAGEGGKEVRVSVPWAVIDASAGTTFQLKYTITRAAGGPADESGTVTYSVVSDIGDGPLQIMGARFNATVWRSSSAPRMLCALHGITQVPVLAEWRYEDEQEWGRATRWIDEKPWLKLYVRSGSETWECRPANIVGNGASLQTDGYAAFVAMRDEVAGEIDMVAWGHSDVGGTLDDRLSAINNVAEVSMTGYSCAARLRDGSMACWGRTEFGGVPETIAGDFVQVRSSAFAFTGRKRDGGLSAWGREPSIPGPVLQHKDYIDLCGASHAFAARRASGHVVAWGNPEHGGQMLPGQDQFDDIIQLASNNGAFTALRNFGASTSVIAWGNESYGGVVPNDIASLTNVRKIAAATTNAHCVLLDTGEVRSWPASSTDGGQMPEEIARLNTVLEVTASGYAFCARLSNGQVAAWGHPDYGGRLTEEVAARSDIVQVAVALMAFAALCSDGTVVAWGNPLSGGNTAPVAHKLVNVRAIYGNAQSFTALTADGRVVTWGASLGGGNSDHVQPELTGKVTHSRLLSPAHAEQLAGSSPLGSKRT